MTIQPLALFVFDLAREGGEFYSRGMLQQGALGKKQIQEMTDAKRGRYLLLLSAPGGMIQDAHANTELEAMTAVRWIIDKNPEPPINVYLRVEESFAQQLRPLYTANVTEQPPMA